MELQVVDNISIKDYLALSKEVYKDNPYYRDSMSTVLKSILKGKSEICKSSVIKPVLVTDRGRAVAVCTFAIVDRMKDTLQLTFFEALANQEQAIDLILAYGKQLALKHGISKILIGLNFHVNYGLGLLADHYDCVQGFGSAYNPPYYIDYFKKYAQEEYNLTNYLGSMQKFDLCQDQRLKRRLQGKYTVRKADFRNIRQEAEIYTRLNNQAFSHHPFYYERRLEEDLELFQEFKLLLNRENLLFVEHAGKPIGFMLWYPDFNELIKAGETIGLKTVLKNKVFPQRIKRFKIVELGVLPEYQKTGAVMTLFYKCRELVGNRYECCESGWILEGNEASKGFGSRWVGDEYKHFKVFLVYV